MSPTDPVKILKELIRCPSVTPAEGGAMSALQDMLEPLGFAVERLTFGEDGTPEVENLYARLGESRPHLMFAGHTDVVPPGAEAEWTFPPFAAEIREGFLYGRGAVDMKGGIACFVAAVARHIRKFGRPGGSVSFLITGDEEGPSINGTDKLLRWAAAEGERWDAAIVGEPTNPDRIGDAVKIGRRGSLSGKITVTGRQGHSAYPHLADNPVNGLMDLAAALLLPPFDEGSEHFQASNLQITSVDVGNDAVNVIPQRASATFNLRFNELWDGDAARREIERRLALGARASHFRHGHDNAMTCELEWVGRVSPVFLTRDEELIEIFASSVQQAVGRRPALSTDGGTSDARFIKDYCPVIEFGLVGRTMHQVDERVALDELEALTKVYGKFLENWFAAT